jgi:outer membrane protein assembly factor BamB
MYNIFSPYRIILLVLLGAGFLSPVLSQPKKILLRDEGKSQLSYEDLANPANNWYVPVPAGRDMQLVGRGRVLIGTGSGYEERDIVTGEKCFELTSFTGTLSAHRLRNGNTLLTGMNWQDKKGIVLVEVDSGGLIKRMINYPPTFTYLRLVRETPSGTFLVAAEDTVFEGNASGEVLWKVKVSGPPNKPHVWQALRLQNGQTIVASGYGANLQVFEANGSQSKIISGPAEVNPHFYSGFQILSNGNYVVTNWQGHGSAFGEKGIQLLEYTPAGELVWSWKQDPAKYSSLQGVIVLDGLDINVLHTEDGKGMLAPVKWGRKKYRITNAQHRIMK